MIHLLRLYLFTVGCIVGYEAAEYSQKQLTEKVARVLTDIDEIEKNISTPKYASIYSYIQSKPFYQISDTMNTRDLELIEDEVHSLSRGSILGSRVLTRADYPFDLKSYATAKHLVIQKLQDTPSIQNSTLIHNEYISNVDRKGLIWLGVSSMFEELQETLIINSATFINDLEILKKILLDEQKKLRNGSDLINQKMTKILNEIQTTLKRIFKHVRISNELVNFRKSIDEILRITFNPTLVSYQNETFNFEMIKRINNIVDEITSAASKHMANPDVDDMFLWSDTMLVAPSFYENKILNENILKRVEDKIEKISHKTPLYESMMESEDISSVETDNKYKNQTTAIINELKNSSDFQSMKNLNISTTTKTYNDGLELLMKLALKYDKRKILTVMYENSITELNKYQKYLVDQEKRLKNISDNSFQKRITSLLEKIESTSKVYQKYLGRIRDKPTFYESLGEKLTEKLNACNRYQASIPLYEFCKDTDIISVTIIDY